MQCIFVDREFVKGDVKVRTLVVADLLPVYHVLALAPIFKLG